MYKRQVLRTIDGSSDFHKLKEAYNLTGQAYLQLPENGRDVISTDGGGTDGIKNITKNDFKYGCWYDINGKEVKKPSKGLFIYNGQKYLFK